MNLIEQLGGYNSAKAEANAPVKLMNSFSYEQLDKELLEYRRENNIFEVGDYIILLSKNTKKEWELYQISEDDIGSHWINLVEFRHATDDEIKVGNRI